MRLASLMSAIAPIVFLSPDTGTPAGGAPPADAPPAEPDFTKAAGDFLGVSDEPVQDTTPASDAADTVAADAGDDTVAGGDDSETIAGDAAADTVAGDVKDDTPPAKEPEKPADKPAEPVADPLKPFVEMSKAAQTELNAANSELIAAKTERAEALKANREAVAKGDIITDEMHQRVYDAQERIDLATEKWQQAATKYNTAEYRKAEVLSNIRETGRQQWAASHAELADSPAEVLKAADKMYESILAEVSKDPRYHSDEARQAVALDRLETKVRQTIDGKKAAKKDPPPQRKAPVRPTGGPLKGGNGATKTGEMEVSLESVEKMLGL